MGRGFTLPVRMPEQSGVAARMFRSGSWLICEACKRGMLTLSTKTSASVSFWTSPACRQVVMQLSGHGGSCICCALLLLTAGCAESIGYSIRRSLHASCKLLPSCHRFQAAPLRRLAWAGARYPVLRPACRRAASSRTGADRRSAILQVICCPSAVATCWWQCVRVPVPPR